MTSTLLTNYVEYDASIDHLLTLANHQLHIFDHHLARLKLDRPERISQLQRLLSEPAHRLRIVVQDSATVLTKNPRLLRLLDEHQHHFSLIQCPDNLLELRDSMLIADEEHALIRFHGDQPRGKLISHDASQTHPYVVRMNSILGEGGHPVSTRVAGL